MKLINIIWGIIIILTTYNCSEDNRFCKIKVTIEDVNNDSLIYQKWNDADVCFFKGIIRLLTVDSINDCTFSDIERTLVNYTSLPVCGIDCQDEGWLNDTPKGRIEVRRIIHLYYSVYIESNLSMKKEDWILCDEGVDLMKFCRNDYSSMSDIQLRNEIKTELDKLYNQCR